METVRTLLQQEYLRRNAKNKTYSLRAFAKQLGVHHATLSLLMAGKRKLTDKSALRIAKALGLSPAEIAKLIAGKPEGAAGRIADLPTSTPGRMPTAGEKLNFELLEQDAFAAMSEWYFDAILELTRVRGVRIEAAPIASALGISELKAKLALQTLTRLGLLGIEPDGTLAPARVNTTNLLDVESTSVAMRRYQRTILEKSLEALDNIPRARRDHTSTTVAVRTDDLPEIKKLIQAFRRELSAFIQRDDSAADDVYQLQISFFPLSRLKE